MTRNQLRRENLNNHCRTRINKLDSLRSELFRNDTYIHSTYSFQILATILDIMTLLTAALNSSAVVFEYHVLRFLSPNIHILRGPFFPNTFSWRMDFRTLYLSSCLIIYFSSLSLIVFITSVFFPIPSSIVSLVALFTHNIRRFFLYSQISKTSNFFVLLRAISRIPCYGKI